MCRVSDSQSNIVLNDDRESHTSQPHVRVGQHRIGARSDAQTHELPMQRTYSSHVAKNGKSPRTCPNSAIWGGGGQIPRRPPLPFGTRQRHRRSFCRQRCIISLSVSCLTAGLCRRAVFLPPWSGDHLRRNCGSRMDAAQSSRHVKPRVGEKEGASASGISLVRGR